MLALCHDDKSLHPDFFMDLNAASLDAASHIFTNLVGSLTLNGAMSDSMTGETFFQVLFDRFHVRHVTEYNM